MRSLNRIGGTSGEYTNNYGFAGTVARKSDGTILTPDPNMMGADKLYGADATEANLKDPEFYKGLGWVLLLPGRWIQPTGMPSRF